MTAEHNRYTHNQVDIRGCLRFKDGLTLYKNRWHASADVSSSGTSVRIAERSLFRSSSSTPRVDRAVAESAANFSRVATVDSSVLD